MVLCWQVSTISFCFEVYKLDSFQEPRGLPGYEYNLFALVSMKKST